MIEPANTWSLGALATGSDSPVMGAWSSCGVPLGDDAVDRDAFAGAHENDVADEQFLDAHELRLGIPFAERGFRPQFHQRRDGGAAAFNGHFLECVREGKEEEEHRAFKGVVDVGGSERGEDHEQIDIDHAAEEGADALDRPAPAAREIGDKEEPGHESGRQAERSDEAAEHHENERGDDAEEFGIGPVDAGEEAGRERGPRDGGISRKIASASTVWAGLATSDSVSETGRAGSSLMASS